MDSAGPVRTFERLAEFGPHAVDHLSGPGDTLVIAFSSIGHDASRAPSPEFAGSATAGGRPALFVTDAERTWTHAPGFVEVLEQSIATLRARQPINRIVTVGKSMGAFAALVAGDILNADATLAFSPQYRIDDPQEKRWRDWTDRIKPKTRPVPPLPKGWVILCHGLQDDAIHALNFPQRDGVDHLIFPGHTHSGLTAHLKSSGQLWGIVDAAAKGDRRRLLRLAIGAGGRRRQLPR